MHIKKPDITKKLIIEALHGTAAKWLNIFLGIGVDTGATNCPLCKLFFRKVACEGCPIAIRTGKSCCEKTPYQLFFNHQVSEHPKEDDRKVHCPKCRTIARKEIDFIFDLIEHIYKDKVDLLVDPRFRVYDYVEEGQ